MPEHARAVEQGQPDAGVALQRGHPEVFGVTGRCIAHRRIARRRMAHRRLARPVALTIAGMVAAGSPLAAAAAPDLRGPGTGGHPSGAAAGFGIIAGWPEVIVIEPLNSEIRRHARRPEHPSRMPKRPRADPRPSRRPRAPVDPTPRRRPERPRRASGARSTVHPGPRRAHAQPEERLHRHPAQPAGRDHRPVRLGQVVARVRHALCRRPAPLCRVAVGLCAPVPAADGEARRRPDRGPVAGDRHRAEVDQPQPALDGRHGDGDLRLPAPAVCPHRHARIVPTIPTRRSNRRPSRRWSTPCSRCPRARG